jgi:uncharacterized protein YbjQ (UPF0145 family)
MSTTNETGGVAVPGQRGVAPRQAGRAPATNPAIVAQKRQGRALQPVLVVTTDTLPGYEVQQVLGDVIGVTARPRNPYVEGVKALSGKSVASDASAAALTRWRQEAIARMAQQARERGANAVIGLRFDHRDVTGAWGEICAYGTAVLVEPVAHSDPRMFVASWPA